MKLKKLTAMIVSCAFLATGCGASSSNNESSSTKGESTASYPITIEHAFGETVIEKEPERIATIGWSNQDTPLALGITPVGVSKANYGPTDKNGLLEWTAEKFKELGEENPTTFDDTDGLDYEAISNTNPDIILAAYSGITQEEYNMLSEIAPVVAYPELAWQTYWRDQIKINSTAIGKKEEGEKLVTELEALISNSKKNYKNLDGKTGVFCYFNPSDLGKFYIYLPTDPRAAYLTDLGLEVPESIKELVKTSDSFSIEVSAENIELLKDADMIIAYGDDNLLKSMQADSLLGSVDAVKNGSVALLEDGSSLAASSTPSALSIPSKLDEYLKVLNSAASKVK